MVGVDGITHRLNLLSNVPYVWTEASQGVLHGMNGVQDLSIAARYTLLEREQSPVGALRLLGVFAAAFPLTDYTPDFQPLSIGSASTRMSWRGTPSTQGARRAVRRRVRAPTPGARTSRSIGRTTSPTTSST